MSNTTCQNVLNTHTVLRPRKSDTIKKQKYIYIYLLTKLPIYYNPPIYLPPTYRPPTSYYIHTYDKQLPIYRQLIYRPTNLATYMHTYIQSYIAALVSVGEQLHSNRCQGVGVYAVWNVHSTTKLLNSTKTKSIVSELSKNNVRMNDRYNILERIQCTYHTEIQSIRYN